MTSDIARRSSEHSKTYGKLNNNSFKIALFSYIDVSFMSKAENKLKHHFDRMGINVKQTTDKELIVVDKDNMAFIKEMYNDIYLCHSGNNRELISQIQEMQLNHTHTIEILKKQHTIDLQQMELKLQEVELKYLRKMVE